MKTFTDNTKREWSIDINVSAVKKVRNLLDFNLAKIDDNLIATLIDDPVLLVDIIYVLCQEQCKEAGITDEQFGRAMAGDAIALATEAFVEELVNFIPNPRQRETIGKALEQIEKVRTVAMDRIDAELESGRLKTEYEAKVDEIFKT